MVSSFSWFLPVRSELQARRGHATVQHLGKTAPDKAIQGQMRHSKMSTTQDVYVQHRWTPRRIKPWYIWNSPWKLTHEEDGETIESHSTLGNASKFCA